MNFSASNSPGSFSPNSKTTRIPIQMAKQSNKKEEDNQIKSDKKNKEVIRMDTKNKMKNEFKSPVKENKARENLKTRIDKFKKMEEDCKKILKDNQIDEDWMTIIDKDNNIGKDLMTIVDKDKLKANWKKMTHKGNRYEDDWKKKMDKKMEEDWKAIIDKDAKFEANWKAIIDKDTKIKEYWKTCAERADSIEETDRFLTELKVLNDIKKKSNLLREQERFLSYFRPISEVRHSILLNKEHNRGRTIANLRINIPGYSALKLDHLMRKQSTISDYLPVKRSSVGKKTFKNLYKFKLLQFHEDKLAYFGTFRKRSTQINGRRFLGKSTLINYDSESDKDEYKDANQNLLATENDSTVESSADVINESENIENIESLEDKKTDIHLNTKNILTELREFQEFRTAFILFSFMFLYIFFLDICTFIIFRN